ncbi:MAG: DMT family transporter [Alphaproteobacteria bacterium]|nr:DMT family transporter [Alphaproteobacteria bacterium]
MNRPIEDQTQTAPRLQRPGLAALWMLGALASFSTMAVAGREISFELTTFELMFWRSVLGLGLVIGLATMSRGGLRQFRTTRLRLHFLRNSSHFIGQFGWFYAITLIPLAQVIALEFTTPIWVALFAPFFLGERMTMMRGVAVVSGFAGILIIVQPWSTGISPGATWALIAALGFAGSILTTKRLSGSETPLTIIFYMVLMQAPMGLIGAFESLHIPQPVTMLWLLLVTIAGITAHYCLTTAISLADAVVVAPLDFMRLPLIAVLGAVIYDEGFAATVFIGAALILSGIWLNLYKETRGRPRPRKRAR